MPKKNNITVTVDDIDEFATAQYVRGRSTKDLKNLVKCNAFIEQQLVPTDTGKVLAEKYGMHPDGEIGKYIDELAKSHACSYSDENVQSEHTNRICTVLLAALFLGVCEFRAAKKGLSEKEKADVQKVYSLILESRNLSGEEFLKNRNKFLCMLMEARKIEGDERWPSENRLQGHKCDRALYDIGREAGVLLYNRRACGLDHYYVESVNDSVYDLCDIKNRLKTLGEEYVIAPAVNLWLREILANNKEMKSIYEKKIAKSKAVIDGYNQKYRGARVSISRAIQLTMEYHQKNKQN